MEPQSKPCIFVGYVDSHKAYKLMDPDTHEIFYERSVHFEESCPSFTSSTSPSSSFIEESDNDDSELEDDLPRPKQRQQIEEVEEIHSPSTSSSTRPRWAK